MIKFVVVSVCEVWSLKLSLFLSLGYEVKNKPSAGAIRASEAGTLSRFLHFLESHPIICRICPSNLIGSSCTLNKGCGRVLKTI